VVNLGGGKGKKKGLGNKANGRLGPHMWHLSKITKGKRRNLGLEI